MGKLNYSVIHRTEFWTMIKMNHLQVLASTGMDLTNTMIHESSRIQNQKQTLGKEVREEGDMGVPTAYSC